LVVIRGTVLSHSPNRDEVYRKARELRPQHSAILYTGTLPDETAVVLWLLRSLCARQHRRLDRRALRSAIGRATGAASERAASKAGKSLCLARAAAGRRAAAVRRVVSHLVNRADLIVVSIPRPSLNRRNY
jgi:hypothetical protein